LSLKTKWSKRGRWVDLEPVLLIICRVAKWANIFLDLLCFC
jgi:hypothetical protein